MTVWQEFFAFLEGTRYAMIVVCGGLAGVLLSLFVGGRLKSTGLFSSLSLAFACVQTLAFLLLKWEGRFLCFALSIEGMAFGFLYGALFAYLQIKAKVRERKADRAAYKRHLQFTLPDKENAYLRDRLHTALQVVETGRGKELSSDKQSVDVRLRYARKMASRLKGERLSPIERLDIEEMGKTLFLLERKEKWSSLEIKLINEIFACLLKLSAKYELAI